ncbi:MAG: radical SAM protein, partial [Planctomycetota bacterium]
MNNLGLYIHIPFCQKKCPYCAFYSVPIDSANSNALIDAIFTELDRIAPTEQVDTLYIGGGSPS